MLKTTAVTIAIVELQSQIDWRNENIEWLGDGRRSRRLADRYLEAIKVLEQLRHEIEVASLTHIISVEDTN